ncbi:hypothetical protein [Sphingomonas spermidinifaciens]|uniref:hypothetical protein n=1 Tax=Sphingomonas spermidinifaciens TaxID=1141889 RepID=UPI0011430CD6|nr:hypothetical protein [Sphingomonas spermidinifaciens]
MNLLPIFYALLAALTGLSLGGVAEVRAVRPAVAATIARPGVAQVVQAAKRRDPVAAIRPAPALVRTQVAKVLALIALPIERMPVRRRE